MYHVKARRLAARHGLGRVLAVVPLRASALQLLVFWSPVIVIVPTVAVLAGLGRGLEWEAVLAAALAGLVLWLFVRSERVAICQGGVLIGSFAPFVRPFAIRWAQVDPATIVFVVPYRQVFTALTPGAGSSPPASSARRGAAHGQAAWCCAGPPIRSAALGRMTMNEPLNTVHGGHLWCAGIGNRHLEPTRKALLEAWEPLLGPDLWRLERQLAAPLRLDDDPVLAARQIPGLAPPGLP